MRPNWEIRGSIPDCTRRKPSGTASWVPVTPSAAARRSGQRTTRRPDRVAVVRVGSRASRRSVASPRRSGSTIAPLRARTTWISQRVCPAEPSFGFHPPCGNNIRREGFHHHRRIGHASSIGVGRRETLLIMEKWWGIVPSTSGHRPLWSGLHFVAADSRAATAQPSSRVVP